jgi:hypothetical protein
MSWTSDIVTIALADNTLTAVIGNRIFPELLPQSNNLFPAVTFRAVSTIPNNSFDNFSYVDFKQTDFTVYAKTKGEADDTIEKLRRAIEAKTGGDVQSVKCHTSGSDDYLEHLALFTTTLEFRIGVSRCPN